MSNQGLMCPQCHCPLVPAEKGKRSVYYTRNGVKSIMRRRICWNCGKQFSTTERLVGEAGNDGNFGPSSTGGTF